MISKYVLLLAAAMGLVAVPNCGAVVQAAPGTAAKPLPFVSPIFGDNMVLQRGKVNTIWGWSEPGDTVRVQIGDDSASGTVGTDRRWQVKIQPPLRRTVQYAASAPVCAQRGG